MTLLVENKVQIQTDPRNPHVERKKAVQQVAKDPHDPENLQSSPQQSWDDTDSEDEEEAANFALMANSLEASPRTSQIQTLKTIDMTNDEYKKTVQKLTEEIFSIHQCLVMAEKECARLASKFSAFEKKIEELELVVVTLEDLKTRNAYLENKVKNNDKLEIILRDQKAELELKLKAIHKSVVAAKEIFDQ